MARYSVAFVIRDWVNIEVIAPNEEAAKNKAKKKLDKMYNDSKTEWIDGKHEYCGFTNISLLNKVPNYKGD